MSVDPEKSKVLRFNEYSWSGISPVGYKDPDGTWTGVTRHRLVGASEGAPFHFRYFEIAAGGHSTFECHEHQHAVMVLRGKGKVRLGERWEEIGFGDVVYVASGDPHQFRAAADEALGFICVVDSERDRPVPLEE
jgi:ribulose-bisphosphate carboxylase large chain